MIADLQRTKGAAGADALPPALQGALQSILTMSNTPEMLAMLQAHVGARAPAGSIPLAGCLGARGFRDMLPPLCRGVPCCACCDSFICAAIHCCRPPGGRQLCSRYHIVTKLKRPCCSCANQSCVCPRRCYDRAGVLGAGAAGRPTCCHWLSAHGAS